MHRGMKNTYFSSKHRPFECDIRSCTDDKTCSERPGRCKMNTERVENHPQTCITCSKDWYNTLQNAKRQNSITVQMRGLNSTNLPEEKRERQNRKCSTLKRSSSLQYIERMREEREEGKLKLPQPPPGCIQFIHHGRSSGSWKNGGLPNRSGELSAALKLFVEALLLLVISRQRRFLIFSFQTEPKYKIDPRIM